MWFHLRGNCASQIRTGFPDQARFLLGQRFDLRRLGPGPAGEPIIGVEWADEEEQHERRSRLHDRSS